MLPRGPLFQATIELHFLDLVTLEKTFGKLRTPALRDLADYWRAKRGNADMPRRSDIDPSHLTSHLPHLILAEVLYNPLRFQFHMVGSALEQQLGQRYTGTLIDAGAGSFFKSYQACVEQVRPTREYMRYNFNDGGPVGEFERLLLPLSEDGKTVSAVLGGAIYSG